MMRRQIYAALVIAFFTTPAVGDGQSNDAVSTRRQVAHCMMRRLRETPSESYRYAFKMCKEQIESLRRDPLTDAAMKKNPTVPPESP
jgi:hypothetical protein